MNYATDNHYYCQQKVDILSDVSSRRAKFAHSIIERNNQ